MKKLFVLMLCLTMVMIFAACGEKNEGANDKKEKSTSSESSSENAASNPDVSEQQQSAAPSIDTATAYKAPADIFEAEELDFNYDDQGKIISCSYEHNEILITLSYDYKDSSAQIYGFADGILILDKVIELKNEYNPDGGFTAIEGIYFKGF